ncbi:MAG: hypothetical protein ACYDHM_06145 [Acidiferrobacterales bacterium]
MDSGQYKILLTGIILVQVIGFVVLWMRIPSAPPHSTSTVAVVPRIAPGSVRFAARIPQDQVLRQAITSVLKQQLAPYLAQLAAAQRERLQETQSYTGSVPPPGSPASVRAGRQSNEIVDRALASGVWTDADSSALLQAAPQLSEAQREGLLNKIFGAINDQELKPVGSLPSL